MKLQTILRSFSLLFILINSSLIKAQSLFYYSQGNTKTYLHEIPNEFLIEFPNGIGEIALPESFQHLKYHYYTCSDSTGIAETGLNYFISRGLSSNTNQEIEIYESSEIVLSFKNSTSETLRNTLINQFNLTLIKNEAFYQRFRSTAPLEDAAAIYETGLVEFSHPNFMVQTVLSSNPPIIPNDPYFHKQYYLHNTGQVINDNDAGVVDADMDVAEAWNITKGDSNLIIAVLDDGVDDNHPDLPNSRQVRLPGANVSAVALNDSMNFNILTGSQHGTSCAGIIAATHDNGVGISGISPNSKIMPVKITQGSTYNNVGIYADAYNFASSNGAKIISGSFNIRNSASGAPPYPVIDSAIDLAIANDLVLCQAAGNTRNMDPSAIFAYFPQDTFVLYPATHPNNALITVGASDKKNRQAEYSPNSQHIDIAAPSSTSINDSRLASISMGHLDVWTMGDNTQSTGFNGLPSNDTTPNFGPDSNRFTGRFGGTSAATPMVAGVAALVRSVNPCLSNLQVKKVLTQTADKIGNYNYNWNSTMPGHSKELGYGKVNALKAVQAAQDMNSATLDLMIKNTPEDFGYEPDTIAQYLYTSEDIWVRNTTDGFVNQWHENPAYAPNTPVYVYVRVKNKSCVDAISGDSVKLYWSKAATALSWDSHWNGSMTNPTLMGAPVGIKAIDTLIAGREKIIQFSWQPPNPNNYIGLIPEYWHFCLLARVESPTDTMTFPETTVLWQNVRNNNNIAWKNITVVKKTPIAGNNPNGDFGQGAVVAFGNELEGEQSINLTFSENLDEFGASIYEDAEIRLKLDEVALEKWHQGGSSMSGMEYLGDGAFLILQDNATLSNFHFSSNERTTLHLRFNMLTEEVGDKMVYKYHVEQFNGESFIGGEQYLIHRDDRTLFTANAGPDETVQAGQSIHLQPNNIREPATYNWYNEEGELIYSGTDTTFIPTENTIYTLEVIAHSDGFKDYDEKQVEVQDFYINNVFPNPISHQNLVTVDYEASTANSAYIAIINILTNQSTNYILNLNLNSVQVPLNSLPAGNYHIYLVCNGQIQDAKPLTIY